MIQPVITKQIVGRFDKMKMEAKTVERLSRQTAGAGGSVLHIVNGQYYAGAARVQDLLALRLPEFGYNVSFACLLPGRFAQDRCAQQSPLYNLPMKHRLDFRPAGRIAELVRRNRIQLLHSHTTRSAMIAAAAARLAKVPHVHHVHCQMNTEVGRTLRTRLNTIIERTAGNRADRVVAVSDSIRSFLNRSGFDRSPVAVVPNGVPIPDRIRPRREAQDAWTIGMVALLRERKGLETLLHAFAHVVQEFNVRLRVVGPFESQPYRQSMLALADRLHIEHAVDWVPFTRDVASEIRQMDLLVLPSLLPEGLPMVLLEAMSAGVPIVGSRVDGVVDVIEHESNGLLAAPGNVQELAQQLRRVLTAEVSWDDLRTAGLQKFQQHFTDRVMARGIAQIYDDLIGGDGSPAASAASTGKRPRPSVRSGQTSTDSTRSRTASP